MNFDLGEMDFDFGNMENLGRRSVMRCETRAVKRCGRAGTRGARPCARAERRGGKRCARPKRRGAPSVNSMSLARTTAPGKSTTIDLGKAQIVCTDPQGELKIESVNGKKILTAKDPQGRLLFSGPIDSKEELDKVPADVRQRYDKLEQKDLPGALSTASADKEDDNEFENNDEDDGDAERDDDSDDDERRERAGRAIDATSGVSILPSFLRAAQHNLALRLSREGHFRQPIVKGIRQRAWRDNFRETVRRGLTQLRQLPGGLFRTSSDEREPLRSRRDRPLSRPRGKRESRSSCHIGRA